MFDINPPLLNSSNRWATTKQELHDLYHDTHTGAVTVRTALLEGFVHDDLIHQHCFFNSDGKPLQDVSKDLEQPQQSTSTEVSSLNTLGYSPTPLLEYIMIIQEIEAERNVVGSSRRKPVIYSVTGDPQQIRQCHDLLVERVPSAGYWMMEINLSCPNIPNKPPPAYSSPELMKYLTLLQDCSDSVPIGLKARLPSPFTGRKLTSTRYRLTHTKTNSTISSSPCGVSNPALWPS